MLKIEKLSVGYGEGLVIRSLDMTVGDRESVAVLGCNGMGKSTLLKSVIGLLRTRGGTIELDGVALAGRPSYERVAAGMAYVPQGRMIFPYLTVEENILTGVENRPTQTVPAYVYECFPVLREMRKRRGGNLSGGQQQQLAIARALVSEPKLLILDEPTEGIQPSINKEIARTLKQLKTERGFSLLVSEQALHFALEVADRVLVIDKGDIVYEAPVATVDLARVHAYLTLSTHGVDASDVSPPVPKLEQGAIP
jgi:urea transport system ATP-binding protein